VFGVYGLEWGSLKNGLGQFSGCLWASLRVMPVFITY